MAKEKKALEGITLITPITATGYNHLNKPDEFKGQLNFKCTQIFTAEQLDEIKEQIEEVIQKKYDDVIADTTSASKRKAIVKKDFYTEEEDKEGEPTGNYLVRSKSKPNKAGKRRFPIYDSQGNKTDVLVFGGSKLRTELYVKPYFMETDKTVGATLYIAAVQIAELAGEGSGGRNNFGKIDGGYVADDDDDEKGSGLSGKSTKDDDDGPDDF